MFFAAALASSIASLALIATGGAPWFLDTATLAGIAIASGLLAAYAWIVRYAPEQRAVTQAIAKVSEWSPYLFATALGMLAFNSYMEMPHLWFVAFAAGAIAFGAISIDRSGKERSSSHREISIVVPIAVLCLLGALLFREAASMRFADSDEVRLIFDAKLIAQGLIPFRDFGARAPALVYALSFAYKVFGASISSYYFLSASAIWLSLVALYLLARRFVPRIQATAIVSTYAIMPVMLNFLYLKTQTFEMLFVMLSMLAFSAALESARKRSWRIASHALMLVALFIRPTAALFYAFHAVLLWMKTGRERRTKALAQLFAEIAGVGILFSSATFAFFRSAHGLYTGPLRSWLIDENSISRFGLTDHYIPVVALVSAIAGACALFIGKRKPETNPLFVASATLLATLSAAYLVNAFLLGFWPQYYMEFDFACATLFVFAASALWKSVGRDRLASACITLAFVISLPQGYAFLRGYLGSYSVDGIRQTSAIIQSSTKADAVIFGGNPVFALESDRAQFLNLSHSYYDPESVGFIIKSLVAAQPKPSMIVGGSYLERYYAVDEGFVRMLASCYSAPTVVSGEDQGRPWAFTLYRLTSSRCLPR